MPMILITLLLAAVPAGAFDLPALDAAAVRTVEFSATAPEAKGLGQTVWLSVTNNSSFREARASDWNNRIEAEVRGNFPDRFDVNLRADYSNTWGTISKHGANYNFFGSGMNLNMSGANGHYLVNGSFFENGKSYYVNVNISGADAFSGNAYGSGLSLFVSRGSISGWFEAEKLPKKAVAAVTAFILALQVEAGTPR